MPEGSCRNRPDCDTRTSGHKPMRDKMMRYAFNAQRGGDRCSGHTMSALVEAHTQMRRRNTGAGRSEFSKKHRRRLPRYTGSW